MSLIDVTVPRALLLTANQRPHWAKRAQTTRDLRTLALTAWQQAGRPAFDRSHCTIELSYPDGRRRDAHNLMPTIKALIDGLVEAGLLPDDDDTHLIGPDLRTTARRSKPGTFHFRFHVVPIDDCPECDGTGLMNYETVGANAPCMTCGGRYEAGPGWIRRTFTPPAEPRTCGELEEPR